MSASSRPIDFDVVKEPWNKYELTDGTVVKTKVVLTKLGKTILEGNKANFQIDVQVVSVILVPTELRGTPDTHVYSPQELQASIEKAEMRYTTLAEEWNEYVVDDGTRIRVKSTVTRIAKTTKYDKNGELIYLVETNNLVQIKSPRAQT